MIYSVFNTICETLQCNCWMNDSWYCVLSYSDVVQLLKRSACVRNFNFIYFKFYSCLKHFFLSSWPCTEEKIVAIFAILIVFFVWEKHDFEKKSIKTFSIFCSKFEFVTWKNHKKFDCKFCNFDCVLKILWQIIVVYSQQIIQINELFLSAKLKYL